MPHFLHVIRAVIVLCRDEGAARKRFGILGEGLGAVVTRTGRPFFNDAALASALLSRLGAAIAREDLWSKLETSWICIDAELMPWSLKAQELVRGQYAAAGAAAEMVLADASALLDQATARGLEMDGLAERTMSRIEKIAKYRAAYRHYCWPVTSLADHLRTGVRRACEPRATAVARPLRQAIARPPRVCAGHRRARAFRPR